MRRYFIWAAVLVLPRTYDPATQKYGNLYSNLLDYVISAALLFYILTIAGLTGRAMTSIPPGLCSSLSTALR